MTHLRLVDPQKPQESAENGPDGPPMTVAKAAKVLGYSRATVYGLVKKRLLGCHRPPGMDIRIYPAHLREYQERYLCPALNSNALPTGSPPGQDAASGTSLGQMPSTGEAATRARELKLRTKARMVRNRAKRRAPT